MMESSTGLHRIVMAGFVVLALCFGATSADAKTRKRAAAPYSPKAASLVMDAYSGRILYQNNADAQCYPASLTKVMTLYLLFEKLQKGNITLNTRMTVSSHAASQAPSRLGLNPGSSIRVEDAILALVTKSANDVAVVVGEYIGGNEKQFATLMTSKARSMGMSRTTYMNASGLPNKSQMTTARDQATLAHKIQTDFPRYFAYFSTQSFAWDGRVIKNHNHLLGKYAGMNGLKTGYTAASGFNLTTTVKRDGRSIIGVVLGGKTARARDLQMVEMLDRTLPTAIVLKDSNTKFASLGRPSVIDSGPAPMPNARPDSAALNALVASTMEDEPDPDEESYTGTEQVASLTATKPTRAVLGTQPVRQISSLPKAPEPIAMMTPPAKLVAVAKAEPAAPVAVVASVAPVAPVAPVAIASATTSTTATTTTVAATTTAKSSGAPFDQATAYALAAISKAEGPMRTASREIGHMIVSPANASEGTQVSAPTLGLRTAVNESAKPQRGWTDKDPLIPEGTWIIQIGAYSDQGDAVSRIRDAIKAAPSELAAAVPVTIPVKSADNRTLYRSRFGGFEGEKQARNACGRLAREKISCIAIPPANWSMPTEAG
ncbi:MAG: D-alanyl-D-alanine carboxypeptidase [Parvibaculaceae bacterium]